MTETSDYHFKKLSVVTLSKDFRKATQVVEGHLPAIPKAGDIYVRIAYAGINATDVNFTNGSYLKGVAPPFDCGLEAVGTVVEVGPQVEHLHVGDAVALSTFGCFAEYVSVAAAICVPLPEVKPEYVTLTISGLTAAMALGELGKPKANEVALVTAAAGGTGQIAVQLLKKQYQCTVIGTCSSADKAAYLKSIGCDHVINYKEENLDEKLSIYAPQGLDVVYESVGGHTFNVAMKHVAIHGRVIVIGAISSYKSGEQVSFEETSKGVPLLMHLLTRSASVHGFFLIHFRDKAAEYMPQLLQMVHDGKLQLGVDKEPFEGVASVADAVDHMFTGKSYGKVVVKIQ